MYLIKEINLIITIINLHFKADTEKQPYQRQLQQHRLTIQIQVYYVTNKYICRVVNSIKCNVSACVTKINTEQSAQNPFLHFTKS